MKPNLSFLELFVIALFATINFYPYIKDFWNPQVKNMDKDMQGENAKWDWYEIWERHSLRIGRGGWVAVWMMLIMSTMFNKEYPFWLWLLFFTSTLGTAGIAAFMMKLRSNEVK